MYACLVAPLFTSWWPWQSQGTGKGCAGIPVGLYSKERACALSKHTYCRSQRDGAAQHCGEQKRSQVKTELLCPPPEMLQPCAPCPAQGCPLPSAEPCTAPALSPRRVFPTAPGFQILFAQLCSSPRALAWEAGKWCCAETGVTALLLTAGPSSYAATVPGDAAAGCSQAPVGMGFPTFLGWGIWGDVGNLHGEPNLHFG